MRGRKIFTYICMVLKYLFAMLFPVLTVTVHKMTWRYLVIALAEVDINRKMLAEMAVNDAEGFKTLAELAKSKLA